MLQKHIKVYLYIVILAFATILASIHNIDLMVNYSLITNDLNYNEGAQYDVREIQDCNLFGCHSFQNIYMSSITVVIIGVVALSAIGGICLYQLSSQHTTNKK